MGIILDGTSGRDTLVGTLTDDILNGYGGDDEFRPGSGFDILDGGEGFDRIVMTIAENIYSRPTGVRTYGFEGARFNVSVGVNYVRDYGSNTVTYITQQSHNRVEEVRLVTTDTGDFGDLIDARMYGIPSDGGPLSGQLYLTLGNGSDTVLGSDLADVISAGGGNDSIDGRFGDDTINGEGGNDTLIGDFGSDRIDGGDGDDLITSFTIFGSTGSVPDGLDRRLDRDTLIGGAGNDTILAGFGDVVDGGSGSNTLSIDFGGATAGVDATFTPLLAGEAAITVGGGSISNITRIGTINGTGFGDRIDVSYASAGGAAVPAGGRVFGLDGNDTIISGPGLDYVSGGNGNDEIVGHGSETLYGDAGDDRIFAATGRANGGEGDDWIMGARGAASLDGGRGNDTLIGSATESSLLDGAEGNDTLSGGSGDDTLYGRDGSDVLRGGAGTNLLAGGRDDDTYFVQANDRIVELADEGIDTVVASTSYRLDTAASVEILSAVTGTAAIDLRGNDVAQTITGNAGANLLEGGGGNDTLVGGGGADTLAGGAGDDRLQVDAVGTIIVEGANEGNDTVIVSALAGSYLLNSGAAVETLSAAAGSAPINIGGNEFSQVINGNDGANILSSGGGGGVDTMNGGLGDDIYRVFSTGDVINDTGGFDTVYASGTSYFLYSTAAVEYLSTSEQAGTQGFYMVGNGASQVIVGNWGDNTLNGRGGDGAALPDTLIGLYGNDTYGVFSQGDVVREVTGQGNDVVFASASYQLRAGTEIEVLSAVDQSAGDAASAFTLRGNEFGQIVAGNNAANVIDGRGGNDTLVGLGGNDTFAFTTALDGTNNVDTVRDFASGSDKIGLASDGFAAVTDGGILAGEFVVGTAAADADDRLVYDQATGRLFFDADGNGSGAAVLFAQFAAGTVLAASDFVVVAPVASLPAG